jgi:cell division protein WhiA
MDILNGVVSSNGSHPVDPAGLEAAPEHLLAAGELRLKHPQASLEELGALADPPMTKDAVAGRIRRLLALADKRAIALGLPTTEAAVSPELLEGA